MALVVGDVLFAVVPTLHNPKEKYFVVVCCEDPVRVVMINKKNRAIVLQNPKIGPTQVYVAKGEASFLQYDSWIGCEELFSGWTAEELSALAEAGAWRGRLSKELLAKMQTAIGEATTLIERQKLRCIAAIEAVLKS